MYVSIHTANYCSTFATRLLSSSSYCIRYLYRLNRIHVTGPSAGWSQVFSPPGDLQIIQPLLQSLLLLYSRIDLFPHTHTFLPISLSPLFPSPIFTHILHHGPQPRRDHRRGYIGEHSSYPDSLQVRPGNSHASPNCSGNRPVPLAVDATHPKIAGVTIAMALER